jgi:hypothetical protein
MRDKAVENKPSIDGVNTQMPGYLLCLKSAICQEEGLNVSRVDVANSSDLVWLGSRIEREGHLKEMEKRSALR